jgi:hypothetical protein
VRSSSCFHSWGQRAESSTSLLAYSTQAKQLPARRLSTSRGRENKKNSHKLGPQSREAFAKVTHRVLDAPV